MQGFLIDRYIQPDCQVSIFRGILSTLCSWHYLPLWFSVLVVRALEDGWESGYPEVSTPIINTSRSFNCLPPNASNKELQEECRSYQLHAVWKDVGWHNVTAADESDQHDEPPPGKSTDIADGGSTYQCSYLTVNRYNSYICGSKFNLCTQIRHNYKLLAEAKLQSTHDSSRR